MCGSPELAKIFIENGCDGIADSRWQNMAKIKNSKIFNDLYNKKRVTKEIQFLNLRIPSISEANRIVEFFDISLVSNYPQIEALDFAAKKQKKKHNVILMIDVGDLREGIIPEDAKFLDKKKWYDQVFPLVEKILKFSNIELIGIGTNLACYGGIVPDSENMKLMVELFVSINTDFNLKLKYLSGSNSSGLPLFLEDKMPDTVNHFRIGESLILGVNVLNRNPIKELRQDTVKLSIEVIEKYWKPSKPIGHGAQNAFGETVIFEDKGKMLRIIVSAGRQDLLVEGLKPLDDDILILGASSDHLELQLLRNFDKYPVGSFIDFNLNYGALLAASTSSYVDMIFY
jgi:predicted amino acid racemase